MITVLSMNPNWHSMSLNHCESKPHPLPVIILLLPESTRRSREFFCLCPDFLDRCPGLESDCPEFENSCPDCFGRCPVFGNTCPGPFWRCPESFRVYPEFFCLAPIPS
ncbi:MAG: hypothetical protein KGJ60_09850, partial [Verrucomicrobiota bacterium]|nr:hypothetical protein [Verrucomicrobiota bacterium]